MAPAAIFAVPGLHLQTSYGSTGITHKRKRGRQESNVASQDEESGTEEATISEYSAVVTPLERSQRRLAGLPLNKEPPPAPFPHASIVARTTLDSDLGRRSLTIGEPLRLQDGSVSSLHTQHLAAMTAIVHRSIMTHDYARAGRSLGLILRSELNGKPIDLRSEGLWGVGAEILLRRTEEATEKESDTRSKGYVHREAFELARQFYESLIVQYPRHKTWPDAVNALDFCNAMYGLWIHVVCQESYQMQGAAVHDSLSEDSSESSTQLSAKIWELEQAKEIAEAMDSRMRDLPFREDPELIRLRGMVALWNADLLEVCSELEDDELLGRADNNGYEAIDDLSNNIERIALVPTAIHEEKESRTVQAAMARKLATTLFDRLEHRRATPDI